MDKLKMHSPDLARQNIDRIAELFPTVVTERLDADGNPTRAIDFDLLRQELSDHVVEGPQERYQLDWPGKREALFAANAPIAKTLRPDRDESVNFDTTKNLFIEGDNLDALKLLQESYLGKVRLIYIDPPYNTGGDRLLYPDNYAEDSTTYLQRSGQSDDEGRRLTANTEANGRFHSDWLSMIYPRLKLARNLLSDDGLIFISIDDHEVATLRLTLDLVFGASNFVENYVWESNFRPDNSSRIERENAQHVLCYTRRKSEMSPLVGAQKATEGLPSLTKSSMKESTLIFQPGWVELGIPDGTYPAGDMGSGYRLETDIEVVGGVAQAPFELTGRVIWSQAYLNAQAEGGTRIVIKSTGFVPYSKKPATSSLAPTTLIPRESAKDVLAGNAEIKRLFGAPVFSHPKPTDLLMYLLKSVIGSDPDALVLDFFAGSSTSAHAVMKLNAEDGGNRRFVMVQLDEETEEGSAAADAGYATISSLSRDRIRRASGEILNSASNDDPDVGFRALKVDATNMADVLLTADSTEQDALDLFRNSVKPHRTAEDLLFEVLLDWGLELSMSITVLDVEGSEVFVVDEGALIACLDNNIGVSLVGAVAARQPLRAVFRDCAFAADADRINAEQIFAEVSPHTDVKVI